jgi:hypothetical protein
MHPEVVILVAKVRQDDIYRTATKHTVTATARRRVATARVRRGGAV